MLVIDAIADEPLQVVPYLNAAKGGGREVARLEIVRARARGLPDGLDAIVVASDLQGMTGAGGAAQLLGVSVAEALDELAFDDVIPPAPRTGVILAGDLYSVPEANRRGGHGEVVDVWAAFAERFAWVVGVAGNHDDTAGVAELDNAHLLDGDTVDLDGLTFGGVSLIIGNPDKRGRRDEDEQLALLDRVLRARCDVLILHEGPSGDRDQPGNPAIRARLDRRPPALTICGHVHWPRPLAPLPPGQILNADTRTLVLTR